MADIEAFRKNIIEFGVLDPEGTHHEFVSGMHGRKLDFDVVGEDTPLYAEWIQVAHDYIEETYPALPEVIVGVANGTNRVALDTARSLMAKYLARLVKKIVKIQKFCALAK